MYTLMSLKSSNIAKGGKVKKEGAEEGRFINTQNDRR
jgi:hypothetical protein